MGKSRGNISKTGEKKPYCSPKISYNFSKVRIVLAAGTAANRNRMTHQQPHKWLRNLQRGPNQTWYILQRGCRPLNLEEASTLKVRGGEQLSRISNSAQKSLIHLLSPLKSQRILSSRPRNLIRFPLRSLKI